VEDLIPTSSEAWIHNSYITEKCFNPTL